MQPLGRESFQGWCDYIKIGLPGTLMLASELWAFEAMTLMSGILGLIDLAAQTIYLQVFMLLF